MTAYSNEGPFTLTSGEALEADRLIKLSTTTAVYADAGDEPVGITTNPVASGDMVSCNPLDGRLRKVTGSKAISAGAAIYTADDGKVSDSVVGKQIGILLTAITADGGKGTALVSWPAGGNDISAASSMCEFLDDFFTFNDDDNWVDTVSDGGTIDSTDANNGVLSIATGATDNDESYVSSEHEIFLFETNKRLWFEARVKLTEANIDDANIIIGLSDTVAANSLLDNGAGPMASYDGVVFFKVDGGTVWQFEASNAASQDTETDVGDFNDGEWHVLSFSYDYNDGVTAIVTPYVDGVAGTAVNLTIAGLAEMHILLGAKAGDTNAETLLVDYVRVVKER